MRWFGKEDEVTPAAPEGAKAGQEVRPLVPREAWCSVCDARRTFTRMWRRAAVMRRCLTCGADFPDPEALYRKSQVFCPKCEEPLEVPGFDYGLCDQCGSKYELLEGAKPALLPNQEQRREIAKHGRSRSVL